MFRKSVYFRGVGGASPFSSLMSGTIRTFISLALTLVGLAVFFLLFPFILMVLVVGLLGFGAIISLIVALSIYRQSRINRSEVSEDGPSDNHRKHVDVDVISSSDM